MKKEEELSKEEQEAWRDLIQLEIDKDSGKRAKME